MDISVPDLLRLVVLPFFGYVAWRDIKTRRVPNKTWLPLAGLAIALLAWEIFQVQTGDLRPSERRVFFIQVTISVGFLVPLSYVFWRMGGFGGADAKAFMVLAVLFPTYPKYYLTDIAETMEVLPGIAEAGGTLPAVETTLGVFSITILSNTVLIGMLYPVALAGKNALSGYVSPGMFVAKPINWDEATDEYGTLLQFSNRSLTDDLSLSGLRSYFSWRRLDLDALRMYLQWRGITLEELRENPEKYRDPDSVPEEPNPPGDGAIVTDGGRDHPEDDEVAETEETAEADEAANDTTEADDETEADEPVDHWGAEAFLDDIEGTAYGTSPESLRDGLDTLAEDDVVWISPGIPFLVPMFFGLVVAFTYGDLLFAVLQAVGIAQ